MPGPETALPRRRTRPEYSGPPALIVSLEGAERNTYSGGYVAGVRFLISFGGRKGAVEVDARYRGREGGSGRGRSGE